MTPRVRAVVVNYNGGDLTLECLRSLLAADWPESAFEVVCVDNASTDGSPARIRDELPTVRLIESAVNGGYGAGCNLALADLERVDHVAFVNNDVVVPPGWLAPLADTLGADPQVGAACPKILLRDRYREITIEASTATAPLDPRPRGIRVHGVEVDGHDRWSRSRCRDGFWGPEYRDGEPVFQWTGNGPRATLLVPSAEPGHTELLLSADRTVPTTLSSSDSVRTVVAQPTPRWHPAPPGGSALDLIHNVGVDLDVDGYAADRGYLEEDTGQYDEPADVFAWCGGAVLCAARYLRDVGAFDEHLFLYYEDVELAWRGGHRGWRYRTAPESVVRHLHSAATSADALRTAELNERNHLLVLARHGTRRATARAVWHHARATGSYARRDVASPLAHGRAPNAATVAMRLRALGSFGLHAPRFVRSERRDG